MTDALADFDVSGTFGRTIGLEYREIGPEEVVAVMDVQERLLGPLGRLHGGVLSSAAEDVASVGTLAGVAAEGNIAFGMNLSSTVLGEVTEDAELRFVARLRSMAPDVWTWIVETTDAQGQLCATATVAVAVRPAVRSQALS